MESKLKSIFRENHNPQTTPVVDFCEVFEDPLKFITLEDLDDKAITADEYEFLKENMSSTVVPIYNENYLNQKIMEMRFCRRFISKMII